MISDMPCTRCGHRYQLSASEANGEAWVVRTHVCPQDYANADEAQRALEMMHRAKLKAIHDIVNP
jgi:hypothetical protein